MLMRHLCQNLCTCSSKRTAEARFGFYVMWNGNPMCSLGSACSCHCIVYRREAEAEDREPPSALFLLFFFPETHVDLWRAMNEHSGGCTVQYQLCVFVVFFCLFSHVQYVPSQNRFTHRWLPPVSPDMRRDPPELCFDIVAYSFLVQHGIIAWLSALLPTAPSRVRQLNYFTRWFILTPRPSFAPNFYVALKVVQWSEALMISKKNFND